MKKSGTDLAENKYIQSNTTQRLHVTIKYMYQQT